MSATTRVNVTLAQRQWCHFLKKGGTILRRKGGVVGPYTCRSDTGIASITYVMANKLEENGLIQWEPGKSADQEQAVLTTAGQAVVDPPEAAKVS
jgi:hypothetical protein